MAFPCLLRLTPLLFLSGLLLDSVQLSLSAGTSGRVLCGFRTSIPLSCTRCHACWELTLLGADLRPRNAGAPLRPTPLFRAHRTGPQAARTAARAPSGLSQKTRGATQRTHPATQRRRARRPSRAPSAGRRRRRAAPASAAPPALRPTAPASATRLRSSCQRRRPQGSARAGRTVASMTSSAWRQQTMQRPTGPPQRVSSGCAPARPSAWAPAPFLAPSAQATRS